MSQLRALWAFLTAYGNEPAWPWVMVAVVCLGVLSVVIARNVAG